MTVSTDGIILLAKQSGITSFSSLWQIKNALGTKKIGHTGTLDTFAEGLLVVLSGRLTRLGSYITDCDKEYQALVSFGSETDTLDPDGSVIATASFPTLESINRVLPSFIGNIQQQPPVYSAIHVAGKRASDRIRDGESVQLPYRPVTIHSLSLLNVFTVDGSVANADSLVRSVVLSVVCSKGTYIRSLARDIALSCGTRAHLGALRRMSIGPFRLEDAAGFSILEPFASVPPCVYGQGEKPPQVPPGEILASRQLFSPSLALVVGLSPVAIPANRLSDFNNGKVMSSAWFSQIGSTGICSERSAVFCEDRFVGVISYTNGKPVYEFVCGRDS